MDEEFAAAILITALREKKAAALLECLFDGGTVTVDPVEKTLVLIPGEALERVAARLDKEKP